MSSSTISNPNESSTSGGANLIINYLPQTMTDEHFRVMFAKYGDIRSARIIRNKNSGHSYGFGFVEYFNVEDAKLAIKNLNGVVINHKKIKVSFARPSSDNIKNANVFVTNLPNTFTENDVRNLFQSCGDIIQCRLLSNRGGTAFILYNLHEEARQAILNFNRKLVPGTNCRMKVKFASNEQNKKNDSSMHMLHKDYKQNLDLIHCGSVLNNHHNQNKMSSGPIRFTTHNSRYNPLSQNQFHVPPMDSMFYSESRNHRYHAHHHSHMFSKMNSNMINDNSFMFGNYDGHEDIPDEYILFVYNIGPETNEDHLGKLFGYYGEVMRVNVIRKNNSGEGRGYGFVTMKYYEDAVNAISNLNGFKFFNNRPLQVSFKKTLNNDILNVP